MDLRLIRGDNKIEPVLGTLNRQFISDARGGAGDNG
jgi:hypothetical protein